MYVGNGLEIFTSGISMLTKELLIEPLLLFTVLPEMSSEYLSKPLQEILFKNHRNTLMGLTRELDIKYKLSYAKDNALRVQKAIDYYSNYGKNV